MGKQVGVVVVVLAALSLAPRPARAWNELGHRIVARIAWDGMLPAQQQLAVALLRQHPRFAEDFEGRMPAAIKATGPQSLEQQRWIFTQAAAWPDLMKDESKRLAKQVAAEPDPQRKSALEQQLAAVKRYDSTSWHFDNKPFYLDPYDLPAASPSSSAGPRPMGIQQALPRALEQLRDASLPPEVRAVALAWVIHLIGDSHQPLHTSAIFSAKHLPQGDLGGNRIAIQIQNRPPPSPEVSLHQIWDDQFGDDLAQEAAIKRAVVASFPRTKLARELEGLDAAAADADLRFTNRVLDESYRVAGEAVYDARVRGALLALQPTGAAYPTLVLPPAYLRDARIAASRRVALAGYRLADQLLRAELGGKP